MCETYMVFGEVSLENENYAQAVEDLSICLKRHKDSLPVDSRCIAETHYQLGIRWEKISLKKMDVLKVHHHENQSVCKMEERFILLYDNG